MDSVARLVFTMLIDFFLPCLDSLQTRTVKKHATCILSNKKEIFVVWSSGLWYTKYESLRKGYTQERLFSQHWYFKMKYKGYCIKSRQQRENCQNRYL